MQGCMYSKYILFIINVLFLIHVMNFQPHYFSLQCHMILQKSFLYADMLLKDHFLLFSMLKLKASKKLNIFLEIMMLVFLFLFFFSG